SRVLLAAALERLGQKQAAELELQRAAELPVSPSWPDIYRQETLRYRPGKDVILERADELVKQGNATELLRLTRTATRRYPDSEKLWRYLAKGCRLNQDLPAAENALRTALKIAP